MYAPDHHGGRHARHVQIRFGGRRHREVHDYRPEHVGPQLRVLAARQGGGVGPMDRDWIIEKLHEGEPVRRSA